MALDKARMKERLAAILLEERVRRGGGDPRRFAQPAMAALLGYSLRQYQRLEDADEGSLPSWDDLNEILAKLDRPPSDIFADDQETAAEPESQSDERLREIVREELREVRGILERLERRLPPGDAPA